MEVDADARQNQVQPIDINDVNQNGKSSFFNSPTDILKTMRNAGSLSMNASIYF